VTGAGRKLAAVVLTLTSEEGKVMRRFAMRMVLLLLALAGTIFADPGNAQPVGGPATGGTDPSGGNAPGGNAPGAGAPGGNVNTGGTVGVNVGEERRYIVEFREFRVIDESGCDRCGSDEAQFIIRTADYALLSPLYGDLDSFKGIIDVVIPTYRFARCAQPAVDGDSDYDNEWECDQRGKALPLSFTIEAWEDDGPWWPNICAENPASPPDPRASGPDLWPPNKHFCVQDTGSLIGKRKVELKVEDLAELTAPGQSRSGVVTLEGGCDFTAIPVCDDDAPRYRLFFTVTRVRDATGGAPVNPNP
jgi:hypothetical protein